MAFARSIRFKSLLLLGTVVVFICIPFIQPGFSSNEQPDDETGKVVIIVHPDVVDEELTVDQIRDIFLGNKTQWANGNKITFFILKNSETHDSFLKNYVNKSGSQYTKYWRYQVFTGVGRAPKSFTTEGKLVDYVARTPGSIGYLSEKEAEKSSLLQIDESGKCKVKMIKVLKEDVQ
ncbi:MAG: substrate-binding domain-containing protein [Planctomycetota bacterium]